ncbi:MAG: hypothetical protein ACE5IR_21225 [bacterium]
MTVKYVVLSEEIRDEIENLRKVASKIHERSAEVPENQKEKELYLDSLALNLQAFYTGVEHIFESIASKVDGEVPFGEHWHNDLLAQMNTDLMEIRAQVISDDLRDDLKELLAFRHVIRNIYSFTIDEKRLMRLCNGLDALSKKLFGELNKFSEFLQTSGKNS